MVSFSTGPPNSADLHAGGSGFWKRPGHALIMSRRMGPVRPMCDIALPSKSLESFDLPILGKEVRMITQAGHCIGCKSLLSQAVTTRSPLASCLLHGWQMVHASLIRLYQLAAHVTPTPHTTSVWHASIISTCHHTLPAR